jgi:hypothetical protein
MASPLTVQRRMVAQAQRMADDRREPFMLVTEAGRTFPRPARKALAMAASSRHRGVVLGEEVEPRQSDARLQMSDAALREVERRQVARFAAARKEAPDAQD